MSIIRVHVLILLLCHLLLISIVLSTYAFLSCVPSMFHLFISYNLIFISCHLLITSYIVLYQTIISYDIYIYISILVRFTCTFIYFLYFSCVHISCLIILFFSSILLYISNLRILLFLVHIYLFSYLVFQLTLPMRLYTWYNNHIFRCGYRMSFNRIWLDYRLNELSIESKNTRIGVRTKEL